MLSVNLLAKRVIVVGSSAEAMSRAVTLSQEGALVTVLSESFERSSIRTNASVEFRRFRKLRSSDFRKVFLVIATDRDKKINDCLYRWSLKWGFLLNTLDEKETCNFYHVATRRVCPSVEVAVSTNGASPAFASRFADRISKQVSRDDIAVFEAFVLTRLQLKDRRLSSVDFDWDFLEQQIRGALNDGAHLANRTRDVSHGE